MYIFVCEICVGLYGRHGYETVEKSSKTIKIKHAPVWDPFFLICDYILKPEAVKEKKRNTCEPSDHVPAVCRLHVITRSCKR